jgi:hypothetical protein
MNDPYDQETPKYSTAWAIRDALNDLIQTEEMNILAQLGADVSYEGQNYYYTDEGYKLKEKFEELSDFGNKMWVLDLAIVQLDGSEIHDTVLESLSNTDLAKRIEFKKLFVGHILKGSAAKYEEITKELSDEMREMNHFDQYAISKALHGILERHGLAARGVFAYPPFAKRIVDKVRGLRLDEETRLIMKCRALLTAYDDFILGLRMNQALYESQEQRFRNRMLSLQAEYDRKEQLLLGIAAETGLTERIAAKLGALPSLAIGAGTTGESGR